MIDAVEKLPTVLLEWTPRAGFAALIFLICWATANVLGRAVAAACDRSGIDEHISVLFFRTTKLVVIIFGAITAFGTLGIDVSAMVAGLGLTGFALGFALKDTISNLLAGALLLIYRPFRIEDSIKVAGFEGRVVEIDLRYTALKTDTTTVLIPNANLFTNPIELLDQSDAVDT